VLAARSGSSVAAQDKKDGTTKPAPTTRILDTRKTAPGLRLLDKLAVITGGGTSHRLGLYDMFLIKDNHVTAAGGVTQAIRNCRDYVAQHPELKDVPIVVEARTIQEVKDVLAISSSSNGAVQRILLDNMTNTTVSSRTPAEAPTTTTDTTMLSAAVELVAGRIDTECSGNVTLASVPAIARTGVGYISSGALTHSVRALDISMKFVPASSSSSVTVGSE